MRNDDDEEYDLENLYASHEKKLKADKEKDQKMLKSAVESMVNAPNELFETQLRHIRGLCTKLKLDFKDYLLKAFATLAPTTNKGEIITLESSVDIINDLENKVSDLQQKMMNLIVEKNKLEKIAEHYDKNYGKHSEIQRKTINISNQENENLRSYVDKLQKTKELTPLMVKKAVAVLIKKMEFKLDKKSWISTQILYKKAKPYFEGSPVSVKLFSLEFARRMGISPVMGGKKKNNKGYNIRCSDIKSES